MTRAGRVLAHVIFFGALMTLSPAFAQADEPAWASVTGSPVPPAQLAIEQSLALSKCGHPESGLMRVAEEVAAIVRSGAPMPDPVEISRRLRRAGEPHVWPRGWSLVGQGVSFTSALPQLEGWTRSLTAAVGEARCGVALARGPDGKNAVVALSVDVVADLLPIPTRVRTGQWVTLSASLHLPATGARVVILGPDGTPWNPPLSFDRGVILSRFAPDRPGAYTVQLLADMANGPRPILEARLFADTDPTLGVAAETVPGEEDGQGAADEADRLVKMTNGLRTRSQRAPFRRDAKMDLVARNHAEEMVRTRIVGHDVGDGSPDARLLRAGVSATMIGENVAHSGTVEGAHRSLYASAAHRENLLQPDFARMGVGVVHGGDGSVWVAEVFASQR